MLVELRGKKDMFQKARRMLGKSGGALRSIAELRNIEGTGEREPRASLSLRAGGERSGCSLHGNAEAVGLLKPGPQRAA